MIDIRSNNEYPKYSYNPDTDLLRVYTNSSNANYYEEVSDNVYFDFDDDTDEFIGLVIYAFSHCNPDEIINVTKEKIDLSNILNQINDGRFKN